MISPRKPQVSINGQHYYYHISFLKLSPAVSFASQSCLRFSIHKGRQKFEEGSELSWQLTSEGLSFNKNHLNFAVFNYDEKRQQEFTLKLTLFSSQGETVIDQCILDYGAYISALKSLNTKHFISQCTMESGATLHLEVFLELTRYALEKLVRQSGAGKSRNDESSRSAIIKISDRRVDKSLSPKRGRQNPFKRHSPKRERNGLGDQSNKSAEVSIAISNQSPLKSSEHKIQQSQVIARGWPKEEKTQQIIKEKKDQEKVEQVVTLQYPSTQHFVMGQQFTQTIELSDNNFQTKQEIQQQKSVNKQQIINEIPPQNPIQQTRQCQNLIQQTKQVQVQPDHTQKAEIKIMSKQKKDFFSDKSLKFKIFFIVVILVSLILQGLLQRRENQNLIPQPIHNQTLQNTPQSTSKTIPGSKVKSVKAKKGKINRSI